jgi:hypothetical protein
MASLLTIPRGGFEPPLEDPKSSVLPLDDRGARWPFGRVLSRLLLRPAAAPFRMLDEILCIYRVIASFRNARVRPMSKIATRPLPRYPSQEGSSGQG